MRRNDQKFSFSKPRLSKKTEVADLQVRSITSDRTFGAVPKDGRMNRDLEHQARTSTLKDTASLTENLLHGAKFLHPDVTLPTSLDKPFVSSEPSNPPPGASGPYLSAAKIYGETTEKEMAEDSAVGEPGSGGPFDTKKQRSAWSSVPRAVTDRDRLLKKRYNRLQRQLGDVIFGCKPGTQTRCHSSPSNLRTASISFRQKYRFLMKQMFLTAQNGAKFSEAWTICRHGVRCFPYYAPCYIQRAQLEATYGGDNPFLRHHFRVRHYENLLCFFFRRNPKCAVRDAGLALTIGGLTQRQTADAYLLRGIVYLKDVRKRLVFALCSRLLCSF